MYMGTENGGAEAISVPMTQIGVSVCDYLRPKQYHESMVWQDISQASTQRRHATSIQKVPSGP